MGNRYSCKQTFEKWCLENNHQDYIDLWDYELNELTPSDIPYGTKQRYYFKCPNGIHKSDTRRICDLTQDLARKYSCKECIGNGQIIDLTGKIFGELTVLEIDKDTKNTSDTYWKCQCSCGEQISVGGVKLRGKLKIICGKAGKHKYQMLSPEEQKRGGAKNNQFRKSVLEKSNNICIISGEQLNDNEVHHIFPYAQYPEFRYDTNNGICIAKKYHSTACEGSYHRIYGTGENNTPDNFQKYVNERRRELGNMEYFDVYAYVYPYDEDNLEIDENFNCI